MTEKLYEQDVYLKECHSIILEITDINKEGNGTAATVVVLDKTIFFPAGGGQPCDLGTINGIPVIDVWEQEGIIYHALDDDSQDSGSCGPSSFQLIKEGQQVKSSIDWPRRFRHMQKHCGEHILSGIFFSQLGGSNHGFHMGDSHMTMDIDLKQVTWDDAMKIEHLANEVIWSNKPVITRYFENRVDAEKLPLRKPLALDEKISIVCVGSIDNPADCVACCGTHPSTSGQVGLIKILRLESYKGMTRVYLNAGEDALLDYENKHNIITKLAKKYSSDTDDLIDKINIQDEKNKVIRQELHTLKTSLLTIYANDIIMDYTNGSYSKSGSCEILIKEYADFKVDDLLSLGRKVTPSIKGLLLLVCPAENTVLLFSNGKPDCGKLVKENAPIYNGKGGGNASSGRALFNKYEYLETFLDLLQKHLR